MEDKTFDIIIVGGGIAGLGAAFELQKVSQKIVVLEQNAMVGGRMGTEIFQGVPIDVGAKFLAPFYSHVLALAKELGVRTCPISANNYAIQRNKKLHIFDSKNPFGPLFYSGLSLISKLRLGIGLGIQLLRYRGLDDENLQELLCLDNKSLYDHLVPFVGNECMDYFLDPALYALMNYGSRDASRALFLATLKQVTSLDLVSFKGGINQLCLAIAKQIPVECNMNVETIERTEKGVLISGRNSKTKKPFTIHTKKVISAVPGNKVLSLLANPTQAENDFFEKVVYSPMVGATFTGKTNSFKNFSTIWFPQAESPHFVSVSKNFYGNDRTRTIFTLGLRKQYYERLKEENKFTDEYLKTLIEKEFSITEVENIHLTEWISGLPIFFPGYMKSIDHFSSESKNESKIFYCGDYLQSPSTEGALLSGLRVAERIEADLLTCQL